MANEKNPFEAVQAMMLENLERVQGATQSYIDMVEKAMRGFHAVDALENRSQQNRPWKVVTVRRGLHEDGNAARARHFATHPEDRDANIVIFEFYRDEGTAGESRDSGPLAGPACEKS